MGYLPTLVTRAKRFWLAIFVHFIICLYIFSSKMSVMGSRSNETDRSALLAFKAKITDDPLGMMRLWNESNHFCEWYGVTCNTRRQRIVRLSLSSLRLGGSISPHVGNLSFLHVLRLRNNSFISRIPPEIGCLRRLRLLDLANNSFGGDIPLNLRNCSELHSLIFSYNNLEGEIPLEFGPISKLQYFAADENNLTGALPPSLGNATRLEDLSLTSNYILGQIPKTLGGIHHLRIIAIGGNLLSGEVPDSLFNISSMEVVDLGGNQRLGRHLPPELFLILPNLLFFSVSTNQFSGPIPISLSNASNLQSLEFSQNNFTGRVPSLERLDNLRGLSLWENQLGSGSGVGAQDDLNFICSLTNATALRWLWMGSNKFEGVLPSCITNFSSHLINLVVEDNYISGSIPPSIDNLIGLEALSISNNSFTGIIPSTLGNLPNLVGLDLSQNSLSGPIPSSLGNLSKLYELDLSSNRLEDTIPSSLGDCTSLALLNLDQNKLTGSIPPQVFTIQSLSLGLFLSDNRLTGPLPEELGMMKNLNKLYLFENMLSGKIPDSLGECTSMEFLDLHDNNFQGPIPSSLCSIKGLQLLDLSSNNLSGQIPQFLASFHDLVMLNLSFNDLEGSVPHKGVFANATATSLQGNNKLCGGMPVFQLPKRSNSPAKKRRKLSVKAKVTIAICVGLSGVALLILFLLFYLSKLRSKQQQSRIELTESPTLQFVSYGDLHRATNGFSEGNLVGAGEFGDVYRGVVGEEGQVVAIKVLNLKHHGARKSFAAECEALRNIRLRNLVKLLTVCSGVDYQGNEFKALIYEFMPNGSLQDWLHQPTMGEDEGLIAQDPPRRLGLLDRINIAVDVSSLLEYVHHEFGTPLVHCDIKPSNILLDGDRSGRVSDFGLAKFLSDNDILRSSVLPSSSIGIRGSVGYAPPEYGLGSDVSTQGDVFSYGILLLEMYTGKRPTDEMFKDGLSLHLHAKMALPSGAVDILDPSLKNMLESEDSVLNPRRSIRVMKCLVSVIEIGVACSSESPTERIDMRTVTMRLHKIRETLLRGRG